MIGLFSNTVRQNYIVNSAESLLEKKKKDSIDHCISGGGGGKETEKYSDKVKLHD